MIVVPDGVSLSSRSVRLRPLHPGDDAWCYALMCGEAGERWRYRGRTPSPAQVADDLWLGVFAQFVVTRSDTGAPAGLVGLYNAALDAGRANGFAVADPVLAPYVTEGFGLLCRWGFAHHGLQRIFLEVPEFNLPYFASLGACAVVEGRLRNYEMWRGRYWDHLILVITAAAFSERFDELLARRSDAPGDADTLSEAEFVELVRELWPLDSLALVEVLDGLEQVAGRPIDAGLITRIDADSADAWAAAALAAVSSPAT